MKMCHQQGAMNVLLQGVAEGVVLQGLLVSVPETLHSLLQKMIINTLQLTTQDQLFEEDDMPLEPTGAEEMVTNWTHGAEKRCL